MNQLSCVGTLAQCTPHHAQVAECPSGDESIPGRTTQRHALLEQARSSYEIALTVSCLPQVVEGHSSVPLIVHLTEERQALFMQVHGLGNVAPRVCHISQPI